MAPDNDKDSGSFAERIYAVVDSHGMPRRGLSRKLAGICGVSDKAAHKWLTGVSTPSRGNIDKLARALGCSTTYLYFGENADAGDIVDSLPLPLCIILQSFRSGALGDDDLDMIARFSQLLVEKNRLQQ